MKYKINVKEFQDGGKIYIPMKKGNLWPFWLPFYEPGNMNICGFASSTEAEHFIRVKVHLNLAKTSKRETTFKHLNYSDLISENPIQAQIHRLLESLDSLEAVNYLREISNTYFIYERVFLTSGSRPQYIYQEYKLDCECRLRLIGGATPISGLLNE